MSVYVILRMQNREWHGAPGRMPSRSRASRLNPRCWNRPGLLSGPRENHPDPTQTGQSLLGRREKRKRETSSNSSSKFLSLDCCISYGSFQNESLELKQNCPGRQTHSGCSEVKAWVQNMGGYVFICGSTAPRRYLLALSFGRIRLLLGPA